MSAMTLQQGAAIRHERNHTRREVLAYLKEGEFDAALARMMRGFERQCRLAGLGEALRNAESEPFTDDAGYEFTPPETYSGPVEMLMEVEEIAKSVVTPPDPAPRYPAWVTGNPLRALGRG